MSAASLALITARRPPSDSRSARRRLRVPGQQALHGVGVLRRGNSARTTRTVVGNSPSSHRSASSTSTLAPASSTRREAQGSGSQAPSSWPYWNRSSVWAFSVGVMVTSPPPVGARLQALRGQPGPQRDVLGVAELRGGQHRAVEVGGLVDPGPTTRAAPPLVAPATMRSDWPPLSTKQLMAGFGPDVGGVDRPGVERLDRRRGRR